MKKVIILFLGWLFLLLIINRISVHFLNDKTSYELPQGTTSSFRYTLLPFLNFDGRNFLQIATSGYSIRDGHNLKVFFPIYPLFIKALSLNSAIGVVYTGLVISLLSTFGIFLLFNKMFGFRSTILLAAFPTSFFFASYYTESLFLLFVLLFFFFLRKKNFFLASVFAAIASGTRILGLVLLPVLLYEIIKNKNVWKKYWWTVLIAPLGFFTYFLSSGLSVISGQSDWNRSVGLLGPFVALSDSVTHIVQGPLSTYNNQFVYPIIVLEFTLFIFAVFIVIKMYKQIDMSYWLYSVFSLFVILLGGSLASSPRYLLVIFPIFVYLAKELKVLYYTYLVVSVILLIFFSSLFLRGYWVA